MFTLNSFSNDFVIEGNVLVKYHGTATDVTIPDNIEKIGGNAFSGKKIVSVSFPNSVKIIEGGAFTGCTELISINLPNSVEIIEDYAFTGCNKLISFYISSSVKSIGDQVFSRCDKLADIDVDPGNPYFTSKEGVLYSKNMDKIVRYCAVNPGTFIIPSSVTDIQGYAFEYCQNLTVVTIPSSVVNIESGAFFACEGLKAVIIEGDDRILYPDHATFDHIDLSNCLLIVPNGTITYYEQPDLVWNYFIIKEIEDFESYSINYELNGGNNHTSNPDKYIAGIELTLKNAQK